MQNNSLFRKTLMCLVMLLGMSVATANASTLLSVDEVQQGSYVTITGTGVRMRRSQLWILRHFSQEGHPPAATW